MHTTTAAANSERDALTPFHPAVRDWFRASFPAPTAAQRLGWPPIARGESTLILAPTGSGKTLAAFLWCINRLMFERPPGAPLCRIVYVSPLKALAVDVERNLRAPLAGIANAAQAAEIAHAVPAVSIRTGDTPPSGRARFGRQPTDILITTPESLYLLLTSRAREALRSVDTVIVDEIHALVPTKRGAHLALSLERLEALTGRPLQRIGLSATQRPLEEVARFLGGAAESAGPSEGAIRNSKPETRGSKFAQEDDAHRPDHHDAQPPVRFRPVTVVDTSERKRLALRIEVPVDDMARLGEPEEIPTGAAAQGLSRRSIWSAIYPKLLKLVREHRSTLLFVNNRRLAERMAGAVNELAGESLVRAHHGSLAREQRLEIEDQLKRGRLRGLVATSSLELGIDMGSIDLVVQIEAPPSVSAGMQRIGRASHQAGAVSNGIIFPKFRGDLVACAAAARAMDEGRIEATRYPRHPLDVLAQQIVAMVAVDSWHADGLLAVVRRAAPFASLSRPSFDSVLDMLSGRYPSGEFAELRPRLTWDRVSNVLTARQGAQRIAILNGGTIPDRGLYGVFLESAGKGSARVGELDEEMVFESRPRETFVLGASTWRIEEITHDRVLVSAAPGQPGKMPFWHGEGPGRPLEFGRAIGALVRTLRGMPPGAALEKLVRQHALDSNAAENLLRYLADQAAATGVVPDDRTLVIERCRDELGDWRVCLLSPLGSRVHAPWAMAATARIRENAGFGADVETMWTDDGFVVRFPDADQPPDAALLLPAPEQAERLLLEQLGSTALFAARFREAAARALLLPRRRAAGRTPLWQQRKRAADLMAAASRFSSFPIILETYRECLRDFFDMPALVETLARIRDRSLGVTVVDSETPSPFAASLLFGYVANYLYDGDAPLAERRAHALSINQAELRDLLGDLDLRELLDAEAIDEVERQLQCLEEPRRARSADGLHNLLLRLGDLSEAEIAARCASPEAAANLAALTEARRAVPVQVSGKPRHIAVEDSARYRDALGVPLPPGIPDAFLEPVADARADLLHRYARSHGPFTTADVTARLGLGRPAVEETLARLEASGRLLAGEFRPGRVESEWCDPEVLRRIRQASLAKLRRAVEPVEARAFAQLVARWQGVVKRRRGGDALRDAIQSLEGAPLPASILETEILPARIEDYSPAALDVLMNSGEVVWCGLEPLGLRDGRVALFLADHLAGLGPGAAEARDGLSGKALAILDFLNQHGASFFPAIHQSVGGGYAGETTRALWDLVWRGLVTNDSVGALRAYTHRELRAHRKGLDGRPLQSHRAVPEAAQGRWCTVASRLTSDRTPTERIAALARRLLDRYGVLVREAAAAEGVAGGFSAVYPVLKALEEKGTVRRGMFVSGLGATQFALPAALDLLRSLTAEPDPPEVVELAAADPANPYGAALPWPPLAGGAPSQLARAAGAAVILVNGRLAAYLRRNNPELWVFLPEEEPGRSAVARALAQALREKALRGREQARRERRGRGLLIGKVNDATAFSHPLAAFLEEAGFVAGALGYHVPAARR